MGFKWSLISIPDHLGVQNVGGRLGAAFGPRAFYEIFSQMKGHRPKEPSILSTMFRHSTVAPITSVIEENHERAAIEVCEAARTADRTVVVGGGHDHGYSHLLGLSKFLGPKKRIGCINIDAHLDMRKPSPKIGSGSPFYLSIESGILNGSDLIEFGIQTHCNAPELWDYALRKNVEILEFNRLRHSAANKFFTQSLEKLERQVDAIVVSLDLDASAEAFAPGVSAPQSEGFTSAEIVEFCEAAGANSKVISLGIFELNPLHDIGGKTARLAATAAFHYLEKARNLC